MSSRKIIILFVCLEMAIIMVGMYTDGFSLTGLQTITRFSGRLSLFLFSLIFLLHHKQETIQTWLSEKFYLLFAIVHGIHLVELVFYVYLSGIVLIPIRLAGGFLGYVLIFIMPVLAHRTALHKISIAKFHFIRIFYMYYIWLIFFLTYLPRVQGKLPNAGGSYVEHVALLGWVSTLLGIKLASLVQFKRTR